VPPLPRILALAAASALALAGCTPADAARPAETDAAAELETAADAVRELDGVVEVAVHRTAVAEPVAGNFGERPATTLSSVRIEVRLDETLGAGAAGDIAGEAHHLLVAGAGRMDGYDNIAVSAEFLAGSEKPEDSAAARPWLTIGAGARGVTGTLTDSVADAIEDGYELRGAGAETVSTGLGDGDGTWEDDPLAATAHVTASSRDDLVALAETAVELDRGAGLEAPGARYQAISRVPDVDAVRLLVAAAGRPDVRDVAYLAQQQQLEIQSGADSGAQSLADLHHWLEAQVFATADSPLAYTVLDASFAETTGWVSGAEPASHAPHTLDPFGGAAPWPDDPAAPACTGNSLEVTFGVVDSAAGTRGGSVRARNVSGGPCAVENVPGLVFRNGAGQAQADITIEPYEPGVEPGRVVVPDGESVLAPLLWRAMSTVNDPDTTTTVEVTAVPGADPVLLDVTTDGTPGPDILDGAEVRVSPWIQAD
jgi:hypothetical protein